MSNGYDPLAVAFYDIAHEGAQVRAIAGASAEWPLIAHSGN